MKEIDLNQSLYELTERYPDLIEILQEIGFIGVKNPIARQTLGRATTLPQGCKKLGKDLKEVIQLLREKGFEVKP